ncbi:uncharacterized protein I303_102637 [Kwoniella dejecticola CBS 10117]|uniref:AN1-type domain-containing protein n=1 Tax=Kwoniella dejecticola CBS 10117 TaxID=1296121 RepID=A0A1A6A9B0_9TREE|nr:uncharacterized protein I303_02651 [Kwoniella dejecticola CBS 10117]OBR86642.1 hypothetical protein I303_02651 [Kwoniella dejecticola CBS 10117]
MSFKDCHIPNCIYQALILTNACRGCHNQYCYQHVEPETHQCQDQKQVKRNGVESWYEPEVSQLMALIDTRSIEEEVQSLSGKVVTKAHFDKSNWRRLAIGQMVGSCNFHVKIEFEDGTFWVMRLRRRAVRDCSDEPIRLNVESEVATCQALHQGGVSVPMAFCRPPDSRLHPKLIYCYQTFVDRKAWSPFGRQTSFNDPLTPSSIHHVQSVAEWFISMEKVKFSMVGSPVLVEGEIQVGSLIERRPASTLPPYYQGPFTTAKAKWLAVIDGRLKHILDRTYCESQWEIILYLALKEVRSLVEGCEEMDRSGEFYIKHDDDRYDHIRADASGTVTGVIDWEWAYTTNKEEAFSSPTGWVPPEYDQGNNDVFSNRENALIEGYINLNRPDLADMVRKSRKYHRLIYLLRHMKPSVLSLNALRRAFLGQPDDHTGQPDTMQGWLDTMKDKYSSDIGLQSLIGDIAATAKNSATQKD